MPLTDSLRFRLLIPLLLAGTAAACVVAWLSYRNGTAAAERQMQSRVDQLSEVLRSPNYPLTGTVLRLLSQLTDSQLVAIDSNGFLVDTTLESLQEPPADGETLRRGGRRYRCKLVGVYSDSQRNDNVARLAILLDLRQVEAAQRQATVVPIATATVVLLILSLVWFVSASRLVNRIRNVKTRLADISRGEFAPTGRDPGSDEIGLLAESAEKMAVDLDRLWNQMHRQQGQRIMHQVAAGMAHQLRNSLTGARIAVELESREFADRDSENLSVALTQIEQSEDYLRQLLMLASGKLAGAVPMQVGECFDKIQATLTPFARHLKIRLNWDLDSDCRDATLAEGPTWVAAITNLVQNALDASDRVSVRGFLLDGELGVKVTDNGPGIEPSLVDEIYEPFVTTKHEGLGLGLAVARRAANTLGGRLTYRRTENQTEFEFTCPIEC